MGSVLKQPVSDTTYKLFCFTRQRCGIKVNISSLEVSKNNQSTFNWGPGKKYDFCHFCYLNCSLDTPAVQLKRYPKSVLKKTDEDGKKVNLNKYLKVRS